MTRKTGFCVVALLITALLLQLGWADVISFQHGVQPTAGYAGTSDTYLSQSQPDTRFGTRTRLEVDGDDPPRTGQDLVSLLRWDISAIPPGSTVQSAEVTLQIINRTRNSYSVHQVLSPWIEGEATWNERAAGSPWQVPGAQGPADRDSTVLATFSPGTAGTHTLTLNAAGILAVQGWVNAPSSNLGFIIADPDANDGAIMASREDSVAADRPRLTVTYTPPAGNQAPTIVSTPLTDATVGEPYTYDVDATGNPAPTFSLSVAPAGMTIDAVSGLISWTPAVSGVFPVTVEATNTEGLDTQSFGITVSEAVAPAITSLPVTTAVVGAVYTYDVDATGNPVPTYSLSVAPAGMTIDAVSGLINWTPAVAGAFAVTVDAVNTSGIDSQSFSIDVADVTTSSFQDGVLPTAAYAGTRDASIQGSDPDTNFGSLNFCSADGDSPGGSGLDASALLKWDLTAVPPGSTVTSASITVNVTNRSGETYGVYQLTRDWIEAAVTWNVFASGASWQVGGAQGALDRGTVVLGAITANSLGTHVMTLNADGIAVVQSWVDDPTSNNGVIITDTINTNGLDFDSREVTTPTTRPKLAVAYVVSAVNEIPTIVSIPVTDALVGSPYTYDVEATGNPAPIYSLSVAPAGMTIDPASGLINWTPVVSGVFVVTVDATNTEGADSQSFSITVTDPIPPAITSVPVTTAVVGVTYAYDVEATGNPAPTYSLSFAPVDMSIDLVSGLIIWTPTVSGAFPVTVDATNASGIDTQSFSIDVIVQDTDGDGVPDLIDAFPNDPAEWADSDGDGIGDNADTDDDNDGMPDDWEVTHGFNPLDPSDATQDADGDGISNLDEFLQGSDPLDGGSAPPRNIILFVGDGMGFEHVKAARMFDNGDTAPLSFELLPVMGQVATANASGDITDSAAAATAIATGRKVSNGVVSMAVPGDGSDLPTALEIQQQVGKRAGLVSTFLPITDATPAAFGAHQLDRTLQSQIANDYFTRSRPNVLFGVVGPGITESAATSAGYEVVTTEAEMQALNPAVPPLVSGQFSSADIPPLASLTTKALDILDNPDGFFLLVEHEGPDEFSHSHDLSGAIDSVLELRDAVDVALAWAAGRADTLIIVTGDHETGGLLVTETNPVAGVVPAHTFSSIEHTLVDVPLFARGPSANRLAGLTDNTQLFPVLAGLGDVERVFVSFQDGLEPSAAYAGTRDATLSESQPDASLGAGATLSVDGDTPSGSGLDEISLLRWDVSSIPPGSTVESAELTIEVFNASQGNYGIFEILAPWVEVGATWNESAAGIPWQIPGAEGALDRSSTLLGTIAGSSVGSHSTFLNSAGTAMVQRWVDDPASNHGVAFADTVVTDGLDFASRDNATAGNRPRLSVTYTVPVGNQAPTIISTPLTDAAVGSPYTYDVEARGNPAPTYSLSLAPTGMIIDPISGLISWTPVASGVFGVTVDAANTEGTDTQSFSITVIEPTAPVITSLPITTAVAGSLYNYDVDATGIPAPTYSLSVSPAGMSIDAVSGLIDWTPAVEGVFAVTVDASNAAGTDTQSFDINVRPAPGETVLVLPTVQTAPIPHGDATDDSAIWVHPTDPALSTIIGTDKSSAGGLRVYQLDGVEIQFTQKGILNNVDIRYDFSLGSESVALVTAGNRTDDSIAIYKVDPTTRQLIDVAARTINTGIVVYGSCMYRSPVTGKYYFFVDSFDGQVEQWELFDDGTGRVDGIMVRTFDVGTQTEGCVADDEYGVFYIGEESVGIWKYGAEPGDGTARVQVDSTGSGGQLTPSVEGLAIYYGPDGTGYLIASSQGSDEFVIYTREGNNTHVGTFDIAAGNGFDDTTFTDGIDVSNRFLGPAFPNGVFVAQDDNGHNSPRPPEPTTEQNHKLVPWETIANAFVPPLIIDNSAPPSISSVAVTAAALGDVYTYDVDATGQPVPTYSLSVAPAEMTIDPVSGLISWTPTVSGVFPVTVEAINTSGADTQSFSITVSAPIAPTITSLPVTTALVGVVYTYDVDATGNPAPTFSLGVAPVGMTIDPVSGLISWIPAVGGVFAVTVDAVNTSGIDSQGFSIDVSDVTTSSFQDGVLPAASYAGTRDASIAGNDPDTNFGNLNFCTADGDSPGGSGLDLSALLKWDLTAVPPGSTVTSASITLNFTNPSAETYEVYRLTRDWVESEVTWNVWASGSSWQVGGAQGALDHGAAVLGTVSVPSAGSHVLTLNADGIAVVQSWVDDPASNHGVIITDPSTTDGLDFDSSEATTPTSRPLFTVTHSVLPDTDGDGVPDQNDAFPTDPTEWADNDGDGIGDNADPDDDNDGMPDDWEIMHGFDPFDPSDAAQDADGDGVSNLDEFLQGTNPRDALAVGIWVLDEGTGTIAADSSGLGNDGSFVGSPVWIPGVFGSALDFDGSGARVLVPDNDSLDVSVAMTVAVWIRPMVVASQFVVSKSLRNVTDGFELSLSSSGRVFVRLNQASLGDTYKLFSTSLYPTNGTDWMHVAARFDGQDLRLYIDGVLESSVSTPGLVIGTNALDLSIGGQSDGFRPFDGAVDEVHLFDGALTESEIQSLANSPFPDLDLWTTTPLNSRPTTATTGEKPQSKVWFHDGFWWSVFPDSSGVWLRRLDGVDWTPVLQLSTSTSARADYALNEQSGLVHVLLYDGVNTRLASAEYLSGSPGTYAAWSSRPQLVDVPISGSAETATVAIDTTGRMWVAYDASSTIEVRHSEAASNYTVWSNAITIASNVTLDDIAAVAAFNGGVGVFWSNQVSQRFGFRVHQDLDAPTIWSADEVPASQSALDLGMGMADDHINFAVSSAGTLYVAIKTGYPPQSSVPLIGLLVRRPDGSWDNLYQVDDVGTRPIVVLNEAQGFLMVIYMDVQVAGNIVYRASDANFIQFGPKTTLIPGALSDPSSTEQTFVNELIVIAGTVGATSTLEGASFSSP